MAQLEKLNLVLLFIAVSVLSPVAANRATGQIEEPIQRGNKVFDFNTEVMPVFTKFGCNSGACHGAAVGRGGFKLSLYGGEPASDYESIVRHSRGRRVNLADPERSLLLKKSTEMIEHGGGTVLDLDGEAVQLLTAWISQGAAQHRSATNRPTLVKLDVTPQKKVLDSAGSQVELSAIAFFSDSSEKDVTAWTVFTAEDKSAVSIDSESTYAKVLRRGRHVVVARFLDKVVPIELIVPLTDQSVNYSNSPMSNFIDEEIFKTLEMLRLPLSPEVDDATFLRRATLDLTGRLPDENRVAKLFNSEPLERNALVEELLSSNEFVDYWTYKLAKLLRIHPQTDNQVGANSYHRWIAKQLADHVGYDKIAKNLILATGDTRKNGPANFYATVRGPREQAELVSEVFMGSRLRCANCHNHPLDRWTQDDYHGLSAIFARVEMGRFIKPKPTGEVIHPRTTVPAAMQIPGETPFSVEVKNGRVPFVEWLTHRNNPFFAKAIVNRIWKEMMSRGLVEPVDDFRDTNPATHPDLLERLAEDFVNSGYDLRHTIRLIASSASYARSSNAIDGNKDDDRFYSHSIRTELQPEVLADAISDVLGVSEKFGGMPLGTRAINLVDPKVNSRTLDVLGRCGRMDSCDDDSSRGGGLTQKLHLFNGDLLNARILAKNSRLQTLASNGKSRMEIVHQFYRAGFSRLPSDKEHRFWQSKLSNADKNEQKKILEDFVWGMLTSEEFSTNH